MSNIHAFVIIDLDNGQRCYSTEGNVVKTFGGETFAFTSGIDAISLPSTTIRPGGGMRTTKASITIFDDALLPGQTLAHYQRIQNCRLRVFATAGRNFEQLVFDGVVDTVQHDNDKRLVTMSGGPIIDNVDVDFPPFMTHDDGRFAKRRFDELYHIDPYGNQIATGYVYLADVMEFKTWFGTPTQPRPGATFIQTEVAQSSGDAQLGSLKFGGVFLWYETTPSNDPIPVVYGTVKNMPLAPFAHYRVRFDEGNIRNYYKVYIYPVACHPLVGDRRNAPGGTAPFPPDFTVALRWDNNYTNAAMHGTTTTGTPVPGMCPGYTEPDGLSGTISYTSLPIQQKNADFEEPDDVSFSTLKHFDVDGVYAQRVGGKPGSNDSPIQLVGDVVADMWRTFGGATGQNIDWDTSSRATSKLNAYGIDLVVNAKRKAQTIERIFKSRLSQQFPVAFGHPRGRFAWYCNRLPDTSEHAVRRLVFGEELVSRGAVSETPMSEVVNRINYAYGMDGKTGSSTKAGRIDRENSEICRASFVRWGQSKTTVIDIPDTQNDDTADKIAQDKLRLLAGVRIDATYDTFDVWPLGLYYLDIVEVTDPDAGFIDTRFYFLGYQWLDNMQGLRVSLLSERMV